MTRPKLFSLLLLLSLFLTAPACSRLSSQNNPAVAPPQPDVAAQPTASTNHPPEPSASPTQAQELIVQFCDCLPENLVSQIDLQAAEFSEDASSENAVEIGPLEIEADPELVLSRWIYLLVAPFPTVQDGIRLNDVKDVWSGTGNLPEFIDTLLVNSSTHALFTRLWGAADPAGVQTLPSDQMLQTAWESQNTWAIIPFEEIDPRWKVMQVDGISPLQSGFDTTQYPLTVSFGFVQTESSQNFPAQPQLQRIQAPPTNLDTSKLASVIMTGTTALVRYTALRMEENGVDYPARDIADILKDADITHISNEVSFWDECPPAKPVRVEARFCSDPSYYALLEQIGADVIELTGNHILDWGTEPFLETLQMYQDQGMPYFGGGADLVEASTPVTLNAKSQDFTFIGCSPAGPLSVWAEEDSPGSNPCQTGWMETEIRRALQAGSIPIITFQHLEVEDYLPHSSQRIDFQQAARQGAVIVSGSQSHFAQTMTFIGNHFIHYGLGNLFFDQMYGQNRNEFVDKHYFYQGKYISTELITLRLEDSARPRLMERSERDDFLETIFSYADWKTVFEAAAQ